MIGYMLSIFGMKSFQRNPLSTLYRAAGWIVFHVVPKRDATIQIQVGTKVFRLVLPPILWQGGSTGIFIQRQYYEPLLEFCDQVIKEDNVVIDCGANQGIYACAFATLAGPKGKIIALEPQDYAVNILRNNLRINNLQNVTVVHAAASDHAGSAILDLSHGQASGTIARDYGREGSMVVPTVTLDETIEGMGLDRLDVIKMDIEGAELAALGGCTRLLKKFKPMLILEATPSEEIWSQIMALLVDTYGYQPHVFGDNGKLQQVTEVTSNYPNVVFR